VDVQLEHAGEGLYGARIYLRAERDPSAMNGRIYSIGLSVMDGAANIGNATTTVVVPQDGKKN
jgi:predicted thioesterase